jgi:cytochrome c oxidase cbb3-type subunit 3
LFNTLLVVIILLAIMVVALGSALKNVIGSDFFREKQKKDTEQKTSGAAKNTGLLLLFLFMSLAAFSQEKVIMAAKDDRIGGLDQFTFYIMMVVIALELLVLGVLFNTFKNVLGSNQTKKSPAKVKPKTKTILDKLNDTVEIEKEESILLDHDYDGIKELDNNLPPWWKYGFYLTILISVIYMINYHITKTAPLQKEEYTRSIKKAEMEIAEYMKNSANNVDESTVKLLTSSADLTAGQDLFIATCAACHGKLGEGTVGPNLTDSYWLHGGGVKDIFKTIKYGWPDKGMKSWKEDFSPVQIAQLTSFIRTLQGTYPPKPKDQQGELYIEQASPADSVTVQSDSTKALISELPKE